MLVRLRLSIASVAFAACFAVAHAAWGSVTQDDIAAGQKVCSAKAVCAAFAEAAKSGDWATHASSVQTQLDRQQSPRGDDLVVTALAWTAASRPAEAADLWERAVAACATRRAGCAGLSLIAKHAPTQMLSAFRDPTSACESIFTFSLAPQDATLALESCLIVVATHGQHGWAAADAFITSANLPSNTAAYLSLSYIAALLPRDRTAGRSLLQRFAQAGVPPWERDRARYLVWETSTDPSDAKAWAQSLASASLGAYPGRADKNLFLPHGLSAAEWTEQLAFVNFYNAAIEVREAMADARSRYGPGQSRAGSFDASLPTISASLLHLIGFAAGSGEWRQYAAVEVSRALIAMRRVVNAGACKADQACQARVAKLIAGPFNSNPWADLAVAPRQGLTNAPPAPLRELVDPVVSLVAPVPKPIERN